jgi:hypothetical protein
MRNVEQIPQNCGMLFPAVVICEIEWAEPPPAFEAVWRVFLFFPCYVPLIGALDALGKFYRGMPAQAEHG